MTKVFHRPCAPPSSEPLAIPDPVLVRAAEIVETRGLSQGPWRTGGPLCAAGAIGEASASLELSRAEMEDCVCGFARSLGGAAITDVHRWNDVPGRTAADVAEALERAAYGL
jgi:hypothetical protein